MTTIQRSKFPRSESSFAVRLQAEAMDLSLCRFSHILSKRERARAMRS
jgi:hypothetical protein